MKKIFFSLVILLFCFQFISAIDTNIQIKTVPRMNVNVMVLSPSFEVYDRFNANADEYGDVSFVFSSDKLRFGLTVFVKDLSDNSRVASKELRNQIPGEDIYIEVVPTGFKIIETPEEENLSAVNLTNLTEIPEENELNDTESLITIEEKEEQKNKFSLSGLVIFGENSVLKRVLFYVFIGMALALFVFLGVKKFGKREGNKKGIRIKKLSELRAEQKEETPERYYGILDETQRKLEETQRELNRIKNREKIKELEEKMRKDEQELRKLNGF